MDNVVLMAVIYSEEELSKDLFALRFAKSWQGLGSETCEEIGPRAILHHKVHVVWGLIRFMILANVWMVKSGQ